MHLNDFFAKYSKEEVKKHFANYISDEKWEEFKDTFMFHFVVAKEKELPRWFVNEHLPLVTRGITDQSEIDYRTWNIFSWVIQNYPLGDKLLSEYGDKVKWDSLSARKDLTLEFINQHRDKIIIKSIQADLGEEFINAHLEEMDVYNLKRMNLTLAQAEKLMALKKAKVRDWWGQKFFTKEYAMANILKLQNDVTDLNRRFNFTFTEKLQVLKVLENGSFEQEGWNEIIQSFMDSGDLTLSEQKDIKWLAWI